ANALSQGAKATASDEHSAPYVAAKICDGHAGTWWGVSTRVKEPYECWVELDLGRKCTVDETVINEPWNRTEEFLLEYRTNEGEDWKIAVKGTTMGPRYKQEFEPVTGRYWRLHTLKANHYPSIVEWQLFGPGSSGAWRKCGSAGPDAFTGGQARIELDISKFITQPGQFVLRLDDLGKSTTTVEDIAVFYDGHSVHEEVLSAVKEDEIYLLNRHAQIVEDSKIVLKVTLKTQRDDDAKVEISIRRGL
ncbi:MAG: discoidin domain-containing protein, partial [Planctomycetes bacterium]|nr:discoidin domain-containing protein [Planctomycetota bacterium]